MPNKKALENSHRDENLQRFSYTLNPYRETEKTYEKPRGKKLTIPDQSLTVKEILVRHTRGQRIPDQMVGYYDEDNDPLGLEGTNIETLDLSEKYDLLKAVQRQTAHMKSQFNRQQREEYENKLKESIAKELSKEKNETQHINS